MKVNEQIVLNKILEILEKIKRENNFRELKFVVDRAESTQKYFITIIYKGEEYKCNTELELYINYIREDALYKMLLIKVEEFYNEAKKIDNILVSIRNEVLRFFSKIIDNIPQDIKIKVSATNDEEVYEASINFQHIGVIITIKYLYDKNKLELYNVTIEPSTFRGERETYELLESIITYLLVKKLFS